jgi:homocysteine S-methyltransferase
VLDGGLATELEARGADLRDSLWSARMLRDDPQAIGDVHAAYFEAGADVAITASYHGTLEGFEAAGVDRAEGARLLRLSVELARRARDRRGSGLVAGSVGPYGVIWANGTEYTGDYARATDDQIATTQRSRMAELAAAEPDLLAIETIPNGREAAIVGDLLAELSGVEAWVSFCCRDGERLSDGTPIGVAIREAGRAARVAAFGVYWIRCSRPRGARPTCRSSPIRITGASGTGKRTPGAASESTASLPLSSPAGGASAHGRSAAAAASARPRSLRSRAEFGTSSTERRGRPQSASSLG